MTDYWTAFAATYQIWAFIAFLSLIAYGFLYAEHRADKIRRAREAENARTLHHVTRCGARSPEGWFCDRDRAHDGVHCDSTKGGGELGSARWFGLGGAA